MAGAPFLCRHTPQRILDVLAAPGPRRLAALPAGHFAAHACSSSSVGTPGGIRELYTRGYLSGESAKRDGERRRSRPGAQRAPHARDGTARSFSRSRTSPTGNARLGIPVVSSPSAAHLERMNAIQIGYARVSTTDQDLTAQRDGLLRLGVHDASTCVDHGMTGANRARPGLREALAAVRTGDTLVVTKLDRLARSLRDAREIAAELTAGPRPGAPRYDVQRRW